MYDVWLGERVPVRKRRVALVLIGIVVLGLGIWTLKTDVLGQHLTGCGIDANGPYATVRINTVGGGLGVTNHQQVQVAFTYEGAWYGASSSTATLPVLGTTTTVVHGTYPPRTIKLSWDGERRRKLTVEGGQVVHRDDRQRYELVSESFMAEHPHRSYTEETVPDDLQKIDCWLSPLGDS